MKSQRHVRPASESFGGFLRHLRLRANLTQAELGARVGYSDAHINRLERAVRKPDPDVVVARFVSALELRGDSDPAARLIVLSRSAAQKAEAFSAPDEPSLSIPIASPVLFGRDDTIDVVVNLVGLHETRSLTLIGPPGIGKTSLALAVAARLSAHLEHGAVFVPLAVVTDPANIPDAILKAIGVASTSSSPLAQLKNALGNRHMLLVLDNLEQLLDSTVADTTTQLIGELLDAAPRIRLLITSRALMRTRWERVLDMPVLTSAAAVDLFIARVCLQNPAFIPSERESDVIAEICGRLDFLPLAIELAAARIRVLGPDELLSRLEEPLTVLTTGQRDLPDRQRTLRQAISWSYDLLTSDEQTLFRRLGVFTDGCTLAMIEAVASDAMGAEVADLVQSLVEKSLLQSRFTGSGVRFSYLVTVRAFAWEKLLTSCEYGAIAEKVARWYVETVRLAKEDYQVCESREWFDWFDVELNNLRAVIEWSMSSGNVTYGMQLASDLSDVWRFHGPLGDGAHLTENLLSHRGAGADVALRCRLLLKCASLACGSGDLALAERYLSEGLEIATRLGDAALRADALINLGYIESRRNGRLPGLSQMQQGIELARSISDQRLLSIGLLHLAEWTHDRSQARAHVEESYDTALRTRSPMCIFFSIWIKAQWYLDVGELVLARKCLQEASELGVEIGMTSSLYSVTGDLGWVALYQGDIERALALARYAVDGSTRHGSPYMRALNQALLGLAQHLSGATADGKATLREAIAVHWRQQSLVLLTSCVFRLACITADARQYDRALHLFAATAAHARSLGWVLNPMDEQMQTERLTTIRSAIPSGSFDQCWATGSAMPLAELLDYALAGD